MEIKPNIFAIIVTFNGEKWIELCLNSLLNSNEIINIIVIDNNSSDQTKEIIISKYKNVKLFDLDKNYGFGQANNIGIKFALDNNADYILLLNQDAWIFNDTISKLLEIVQENAIVSPLHLNGLSDNFDINFKDYIINSLDKNHLLYDLVFKKSKKYYEVEFINAACWFIPKTVLNVIGGFNPLFFHYGEDLNYYHRMQYNNIKFLLSIDSYICHDRIQLGNGKVFNKNIYLRSLVLEYSNINKGFFSIDKKRIKIHCYMFLKFIQFIFTFKFKRALSILFNYFSFFFKIKKIMDSRNNELFKKKNWL